MRIFHHTADTSEECCVEPELRARWCAKGGDSLQGTGIPFGALLQQVAKDAW